MVKDVNWQLHLGEAGPFLAMIHVARRPITPPSFPVHSLKDDIFYSGKSGLWCVFPWRGIPRTSFEIQSCHKIWSPSSPTLEAHFRQVILLESLNQKTTLLYLVFNREQTNSTIPNAVQGFTPPPLYIQDSVTPQDKCFCFSVLELLTMTVI